jgi:hypothetical protein
MRFRSISIIILAFMVSGSALYLWRRPRPAIYSGARESGVTLPSAGPPSAPSPRLDAPPTAREVRARLDRVFGRALDVDQGTRPPFVSGDFNGDGAADLAVAVRPRGDALSTLNAEMTAWSLQDAAAASDAVDGRPPRVAVAAGDVLLAVVHGVQDGGWRSEEARQAFLVKNAVGAGLSTRPLAEMPPAVRMTVVRGHAGDVLVGERDGRRGVALFNGGAYRWADVGP